MKKDEDSTETTCCDQHNNISWMYGTIYVKHKLQLLSLFVSFSEGIVVKQRGAPHQPVVVRHSSHGIYNLDYSPMYLDFFVRHVYPKLDESHNAVNESREV